MKIGLVCPYNMFRGGGVQECVMALRKGIIARGHEAYILTPQPSDYNGQSTEGILLIGSARPIRAARTSSQVSASVDIEKLDALLHREQFDILHFHEPWVPILSRQIMLRSNAINIATFHAAMSERRTSRTVEKVITPYTKSIFKYIDIMTAVSPTATNYVGTLTSRKLIIVPNGIDLSKYKFNESSEESTGTKTIFYIGRLERRKGVNYLLSAFDLLSSKDASYRLIIAGDGPDRSKLEAQVERESIKGVKFLGYIDEKTKLQLFQKSDLFCSPALYGESFGIVLLEAMATGCVTVAGNNSGYESVMKGRGQLSIVNPKDETEFARRIELLINDDLLRQVWKDWAKEHVLQYDYTKVIDRYISIYETAYEKRNSKT